MAYETQDRGATFAYARYLAAMDASMRQKVALTAAHLLSVGDLADMGMGSGSGSHALASLYPGLSVVGVDVNPTMVEQARQVYALPNLRFVVGDVAAPCFPADSQEAILNSSVLHHVTSFNDYSYDAARAALRAQAAQLAPHGVLIVRDFPALGDEQVWLDLPTGDGSPDASDLEGCSSAALFERFAREFRSLRPEAARGFPFRRLEGSPACPLAPGFRRYALSARHAAEFVLRKDYRTDWVLEVQEEYGTLTQAQYEELFASLGMRVLASTPLWNPWIVAHRFRGHFVWRAEGGAEVDWPPTNLLVVGQKVPAGEGVRIVEGPRQAPLGYLQLACYKDAAGTVFDLVRRPGATVDVLPWFVDERDQLCVLARRGYPRPIPAVDPGETARLDGVSPACYLTEPLNVQQGDRALGVAVEELLARYHAIGREGIRRFEPGGSLYPSPGGLQEEARAVFVEIAPCSVQTPLANASGFSSAGQLRALEACQLLRAAQVGALPEARLELLTYGLLARRGRSPGPWIGEAIALESPPQAAPFADLDELLARPSRRAFVPVPSRETSGFLEVVCARFRELDAAGEEVAARPLEYALPRPLSWNTLAVAPLRNLAEGIALGVDDTDLPAAQCFAGNSELLVAPAWRLPHEVRGMRAARAWVAERLAAEYGLRIGRFWSLGGRYHPSPGATPEVVFPLACEVLAAEEGRSRLRWVSLRALAATPVRDGHLRVVAQRAAHALGLLEDPVS